MLKSVRQFKPGDHIIYRVTKHSTKPGPRARKVAPSPHGDNYTYQVDKFWIVDRVLEDGQLLIRTRRGKTRVVSGQDLNLRPPAWWENLLYRGQFPQALSENSSENATAGPTVGSTSPQG
ncbi:hypothetical protein [Planctomicrobium sp. SH664]|uniref:hypothetical protein n=1 Tax=Planctomicrobium sp. SH664 TaxID=3448125 RepID=UPI003F5BE16B